jgi:hypothetical protein
MSGRMPISPLEGRARRESRNRPPSRRERPAWVMWMALCVGVFFTGIGLVLLLWGLSWQSWSISPRPIGDEGLVGGPVVLPLGVFCIVLGIMWLLQGWTGFRRPEDGSWTRTCPNCGRTVEEDLDFCYHCMKRLHGPATATGPEGRRPSGASDGQRKLGLDGLDSGPRGRRK